MLVIIRNILIVSYLFLVSGCAEMPASKSAQANLGDSFVPKVHFLNVGNGDCHVIECSYNTTIIADCGGGVSDKSKNPNAMTPQQIANYVNKFIERKNVIVTVSHPHADHYSRIPEILSKKNLEDQGATLKAIYYGGKIEAYPETFRNWYNSFDSPAVYKPTLGFPYRTNNFSVGEEQLNCGRLKNSILMVNAKTPATGKNEVVEPGGNVCENGRFNADSLVLGLYNTVDGSTAYLPGDATRTTTSALKNKWYGSPYKNGVSLASMAHHGADTEGSNNEEIVELIKPKTVIASAGNNQTCAHPKCDVVRRYQFEGGDGQNRRPIVRNSAHPLSCYARNDKDKWVPRDDSTNQDVYSTFSSGTIVVPLKQGNDFKPDIECFDANGNKKHEC